MSDIPSFLSAANTIEAYKREGLKPRAIMAVRLNGACCGIGAHISIPDEAGDWDIDWAAEKWDLSSHDLMNWAIGFDDGFLSEKITPSSRFAGNSWFEAGQVVGFACRVEFGEPA